MPTGTFLANQFLQSFNTTYLWMALSSADLGPTSFGNEVPNAYNYSRFALGLNAWTTPANGQSTNLVTISFPVASGTWGLVTTYGLLDSPSWGAGNLWIFNDLPLQDQATVFGGQQVVFQPGQLILQQV